MRERDQIIYSNARRIYSHYIKRYPVVIRQDIVSKMLADKEVLALFPSNKKAVKSFDIFRNKRTFTSREIIYQEHILHIYEQRTTENLE